MDDISGGTCAATGDNHRRLSCNAGLSTKLIELAEEQLAMERRLKMAVKEGQFLRERHLETVSPWLERYNADKCGNWVARQYMWEWFTYMSQQRAERAMEKQVAESKRLAQTYDKDIATLHRANSELETENQNLTKRAEGLESNYNIVRQEAIEYAGKADKLAKQLGEAEKVIFKLQNESQQVAAQVRQDVECYTSNMQQLHHVQPSSARGASRSQSLKSLHFAADSTLPSESVCSPTKIKHRTDANSELKSVKNVDSKVDELRSNQGGASIGSPYSSQPLFPQQTPQKMVPAIRPVYIPAMSRSTGPVTSSLHSLMSNRGQPTRHSFGCVRPNNSAVQ